jgi:RimJ/RimL family protein N-acetyltransferase
MQDEDAGDLLEILSQDPLIRERVGVAAKLKTEQDVRDEVLSMNEDDGLIRYMVVENEKIVGLVSLWRDSGYFGQKADPNAYGFGYFLSTDARGRGLVTDSLSVLMQVVADNLKVNAFLAFCESDNKPSGAVLEKVGFRPTDTTYVDPNKGWIERRYEKTI